MSTRSPRSAQNPPRASLWARILGQQTVVAAFLAMGALGMLYVYSTFTRPAGRAAHAVVTIAHETGTAENMAAPAGGQVRQRVRQSPAARRVGIIAGHKDYDPGSVCDDGLTEADVNLGIARQVVSGLQAGDVSAEILAEYDPRLNDYAGLLLLSIHADSCKDYGDSFTGFKIASANTPGSDILGDCLFQAYQAATQLPLHANTITSDMTEYHAFRQIAPTTPAAIIETGFLNRDRRLLTDGSATVAAGIVAGLECFLGRQP